MTLMYVLQACFAMCMDGINKVPKCRYGEPECYFTRQVQDHTKTQADSLLLNRGAPAPPTCGHAGGADTGRGLVPAAVEGSSDSDASQLAIPIVVSCPPPSLVVVCLIPERQGGRGSQCRD